MSDDEFYSRIPVPKTTAFRPPLVSVIVEYLVLVLTLAAFIYGVISWYLIKKFRHFKNFVFINAIASSLLRLLTVSIIIPIVMHFFVIDSKFMLEVCHYICTYSTTAQNYWLLVICHLFYTDIVKVFGGHINRKYMKSCMFAWGIPFIMLFLYYSLIYFQAERLAENLLLDTINYIEVFMTVSPLIINCIIYFSVISSLCSNSSRKAKTTSTNNFRRFYIATLLFVLSDVIMLFSFIWDSINISFLIRAVLSKLQQIAIDIFLPIVKGNRELWRKYFSKFRESK
ncbi:hypothetical protein PYW08_010723 [Mythimna loreyi]|uniref:Uncharacterized protein n=1 Tax=Mythimna loreyi TaxID=667449 RepID=A0ACC2Q5P2_9NEOP|nr:hypothetical protein PYW08_010723 [Mythimna loreyi]